MFLTSRFKLEAEFPLIAEAILVLKMWQIYPLYSHYYYHDYAAYCSHLHI